MENVRQHLTILGKKAKDKITKVSGIATSISFDLYGCIQATIDRGVDKDGKSYPYDWYDVGRLIIKGKPVMKVPDFEFGEVAKGRKGPATKAPMRG